MKGRKQEIEHIERMKNAELDLFKDKIADEVVDKMKKVKKVGAIKVVHGGGHKGENNQRRTLVILSIVLRRFMLPLILVVVSSGIRIVSAGCILRWWSGSCSR